MEKLTFNKFPFIELYADEGDLTLGWEAIASRLKESLASIDSDKKLIALETYQGVYMEELLKWLKESLDADYFFNTKGVFKKEEEIEAISHADVTDDRIFGYMSRLNMEDYMDAALREKMNQEIRMAEEGTIIVFGYGASLVAPQADILVYADMARWEIQQRMRRNEVDNLGVSNRLEAVESKYKRAYFVDWRILDRLKKKLFKRWDFLLDTNRHDEPKLVKGELIRQGLDEAVSRPFSLVPFFDPGPWGGQWMKEFCDLDKSAPNYAWCFNCVPEENSLLFKIEESLVEIPSINLVFYHPRKLLGEAVHARFGDEFPIRFDFLDTMEGGHLSLQVHPLTEYIQEKFGVHYTQDESYYMLDAGPGAKVYLGLKEGIDPDKMLEELKEAQSKGTHFDAEKHVETWDVKKHDHILIPGGTIHCSGKDSMVLEISSTPYIFTFKLWDWGRVGMDGKPRPINIEHGKNVIQWDRTTQWTKDNLVNRIEKIAEGDGWIEEKTGLHEREFIETRRFWFSKQTDHDTYGGVHVLNLIEGDEVLVESPDHSFKAFHIKYAETFVVPANVGKYSIRPVGQSEGKTVGIIKAFVRS